MPMPQRNDTCDKVGNSIKDCRRDELENAERLVGQSYGR